MTLVKKNITFFTLIAEKKQTEYAIVVVIMFDICFKLDFLEIFVHSLNSSIKYLFLIILLRINFIF